METPDKRIDSFLRKHHVFTLATARNNVPWCSTCFYAYLDREAALVFTSDDSTRHASEMLDNPVASGTVALETKIVGKIQGLQFEGRVFPAGPLWEDRCRKAYYARFPYALLAETHFWVFLLGSVKMTDNRLGFGKKLYWNRGESLFEAS